MQIQPKDTSRGHFVISIAKSVVRICAGASLATLNFELAGGLFVIAEALGILEELV
jgi:hypothetical protein